MKITEKKINSDEYVALLVQHDGVPDKTVTIHLDALAEGRTTIKDEVEKAEADAYTRSDRARVARESLKELGNL